MIQYKRRYTEYKDLIEGHIYQKEEDKEMEDVEENIQVK